ncbi:hypothetical protein EDD16DRAFT_1519830 [Pisolithus croceorrhizus]|nr:hypothetical protein EV401DRAFT_2099122 [Pisolithus croceorrhizus]KAI6117810.1 hypothetical protein EDD16DRAFT_1519830 [Pisolithus croceorrhizus]
MATRSLCRLRITTLFSRWKRRRAMGRVASHFCFTSPGTLSPSYYDSRLLRIAACQVLALWLYYADVEFESGSNAYEEKKHDRFELAVNDVGALQDLGLGLFQQTSEDCLAEAMGAIFPPYRDASANNLTYLVLGKVSITGLLRLSLPQEAVNRLTLKALSVTRTFTEVGVGLDGSEAGFRQTVPIIDILLPSTLSITEIAAMLPIQSAHLQFSLSSVSQVQHVLLTTGSGLGDPT